MTRFRVYSDLHFEFHQDAGVSFVESLDPGGVDVVVLAGDISTWSRLPYALKMFSDRFPKVLFVVGNHEFYGSDRPRVEALLEENVAKLPNVHWLRNTVLELNGHRILGTPLWFPKSPQAIAQESVWSDFKKISNFKWVYYENQVAAEFLKRELCECDIIITHYLPSNQCVHPKYRQSSTNCYFVSDHTELIKNRKPRLWIHGHTHESMHFQMGLTEIVCNPFGYAAHEENPNFDPGRTITV